MQVFVFWLIQVLLQFIYMEGFACTISAAKCTKSKKSVPMFQVVNIPGNKVCRGNTIYEYIGPAPPLYTGLHRYTFLVYQQPGEMKFHEQRLCSTSAEGRGRKSVKKFACKYKLGEPIASNFFYAKWDEWVDEMYKIFKKKKDLRSSCTSKRTCQYCYKD